MGFTLSRSLKEQASLHPLQHHRVRQPLLVASAAITMPLLAALATHAVLVVARVTRALRHAPSMANSTTASGLAANVLSLELTEECDISVMMCRVVGHIQHGIYYLPYVLAFGASSLID